MDTLDNRITKMIISHTPEETRALGERIGRSAPAGCVLALDGDLGAGKTVLAQGIAAGLGITERVTSPTFTILISYDEGRLPLYHFDLYRLEEPEELDEIGCEECFYGSGVSVVEWADSFPEVIPETAVHIHIRRVDGEDDTRTIEISGECGKVARLLNLENNA